MTKQKKIVVMTAVVAGGAVLAYFGNAQLNRNRLIQNNGAGSDEIAQALRPLHRHKSQLSPSESVAGNNESGQTFDQFASTYVDRGFKTLYVQPISPLSPEQEQAVNEAADFLAVYFAGPTKILPPIPDHLVPPSARRLNKGIVQFSTDFVRNEILEPRRPDDAIAVLAVTATDLFPADDWNYVFGQASLVERVGVWSLYRYGDPGSEKFRRRFLKVAVHETGHMFGIRHCTEYDCLMNFANNLGQLDRDPMWFCPECVQKVALARGVRLVDYFSSLAAYAESHGLTDEAVHWAKSRDAVANVSTK